MIVEHALYGRTGRMIALSLCILAVRMMASEPAPPMKPSPAIELIDRDRPLIIAHRGFSGVAPENTIAAFEAAIEANADLIELDYHHSKDGIPVVIHDFTLDRTTDAANRWGSGKLKVSDKRLAELKTLDAGSWYSKKFAGEQLPDLAEALEAIQKGSITLIERKAGDAAVCVTLIRDKDLVNRVVVQSFDWDFLRDYHASEPDQVLAALGPPGSKDGRKLSKAEKELNAEWCDEISELGARIVVWNGQLDRAGVEAAHDRGLKVWVYTINEAATAGELLEAGVDGIITDQPARLREFLIDRTAAK